MGQTKPVNNFQFRLTSNTLLLLLLLKIFYSAGSTLQGKMFLYLVSYIQDSFPFIVNYLAFMLILRLKFQYSKLLAKIIFYINFIVLAAVSILYTPFIIDILSFPINIFAVESEVAAFFFQYFLNIRLIVIFLSGLIIIFSLSYFFPKKIKSKSLPVVIYSAIVAILFIITIGRPAINPLVYSVQDEIQYLMNPSTTDAKINKLASPASSNQSNNNFGFLDKRFDAIPITEIGYDKIVVLVMEGFNYEDFINESSKDSGSFYEKRKNQCQIYSNYHTLNLDSYTSLISMLNSIFVPHQAYVDEKKYSFINESANLVRFFNRNGFSTFFVTSYGEQQLRFVPDLREWTKVIVEENIENNEEFACVSTNKIEKACEDFSVFAEIFDLLKNNSKAFIFQEMVYGHTAEWIEKTGLKPIEYYNKYFNAFYEELEKTNLLDSTLLIITSDHGPRINATDRRHYNIPLIFCARDIEHSTNDKFLSHLNFKDVLLETISGIKDSSDTKEMFTIGNSGELVYGRISEDQKYIFINNRNLAVHTNAASQEVEQFNKDYQNYLNYFEGIKTEE